MEAKYQRYDFVPTIFILESSGRRWEIVGCGVDSCRKSEAASFRAGGNLRAFGRGTLDERGKDRANVPVAPDKQTRLI
jgi:hypothetical protein